MDPREILVVDDRDEDLKASADAIEEAIGRPTSLKPSELKERITGFFSGVRGGGAVNQFDDFRLIIVDNGLGYLDIPGPPLTAESIAGFLRAYSSVEYVVSLNKNSTVDFDLRYLVGDFTTKADLALNTRHLSMVGLWKGSIDPANREFRPWYWPILLGEPARRKAQVEFLLDRLEQPILETLGFPENARTALSRHATGFLSPFVTRGNAKSLEETTFWDHFCSSERTLPRDERASLAFPGTPDRNEQIERLERHESPPAEAHARLMVARVIAGELDFWFRRDVLGPEDVLVDVPHLLMKLRFRGTDGEEDLDTWSRSAIESDPPFGLPEPVFAKLSKYQYSSEVSFWLPRPSFWWQDLERDTEIAAMRSQAEKRLGFVFCEDTCRFVDKEAGEPRPQSFVTEHGRPWDARFVERLEGFGYLPQSQFAK